MVLLVVVVSNIFYWFWLVTDVVKDLLVVTSVKWNEIEYEIWNITSIMRQIFGFFWYHLRADALRQAIDLTLFSFKLFQICAILFAVSSGYWVLHLICFLVQIDRRYYNWLFDLYSQNFSKIVEIILLEMKQNFS